MPDDGTVLLEGVRLIFRNFTGKEGPYNREGDRNFGVIIPNETPEQQRVLQDLIDDGWNVKYLKPREDEVDEDPNAESTPWLQVKLGYSPKSRPPKVVMITSRGRTNLDESTVDTLDWADIQNVDLIIRPYRYDVQGRQGISAYLQSIYVTIEEDALERKYAEMDEQ